MAAVKAFWINYIDRRGEYIELLMNLTPCIEIIKITQSGLSLSYIMYLIVIFSLSEAQEKCGTTSKRQIEDKLPTMLWNEGLILLLMD